LKILAATIAFTYGLNKIAAIETTLLVRKKINTVGALSHPFLQHMKNLQNY
jgi:hypothetical protein